MQAKIRKTIKECEINFEFFLDCDIIAENSGDIDCAMAKGIKLAAVNIETIDNDYIHKEIKKELTPLVEKIIQERSHENKT